MKQKSDRRIAVIGAGLIGRKHIKTISELACLDAVVDPETHSRELAEAAGTNWYGDLASYLESTPPDGAIIATPNQLHLDHGRACLEAGVPVLIEKPLAGNSQDAEQLVALSLQTGVPILVGHHRRHSPIVKAVKGLIDDGGLGRLVAVNALFWLHKPDDYFDVAWRRREGGGPTYINLIHDVDLLRHLCGEIVSVQATESHSVRGLDVEDTSAVILAFESGALGTVSISDTVPAPWSWELTAGENPSYPRTNGACYLLGGTEASLSVPDLRLWRHTGEKSWWAPIGADTIAVEEADPIEEQFRHFLDVVAGEAQPLVPASEGAKSMLAVDAIKNAALHGATQTVGCVSPMVPLDRDAP